MPSSLELQVRVDPTDGATLRTSGYRLCLARRVNGKFAIAWQATSEYLDQSRFVFSGRFRVFAESMFAPGHEFDTRSQAIRADPGHSIRFGRDGLFDEPADGSRPDAIEVHNQRPPVLFQLEEAASDNESESSYLLVYTAEHPTPTNQLTDLIPEDVVLAWFSPDQKAGEPIESLPDNALEVEFSGDSLLVREFSRGEWRIPG